MNQIYYRIAAAGILSAAVIVRYHYDTRRFTQVIQSADTEMDPKWAYPGLFIRSMAGGITLFQLVKGAILALPVWGTAEQVVCAGGVILAIAGSILATWPRVMRDRMSVWTPPSTSPDLVRGHVLVVHGPYRYIRHPFYAGVLLLFAGCQLVAASWTVMLFPVFAILVAESVRTEEAQLARVYGPVYQNYQKRTWRLFPPFY